MIALQKHWSAIRAAELAIQKIRDRLQAIEKEGDVTRREIAKSDDVLNKKRAAIKGHESDLKERESKIMSLEKRKDIIRTEKELHAIEKEIDVLRLDADSAEESALILMEELDEALKSHDNLKSVLQKNESGLDEARKSAASSLDSHEKVIRENREAFEHLIGDLPGAIKSKFQKLLGSREGVGIARVEGEICGFCNFKIPAHLAIAAGDESSTVNCTNCGRYIYR